MKKKRKQQQQQLTNDDESDYDSDSDAGSNDESGNDYHPEFDDNELVINYNDAVIYGRDLNLLLDFDETEWLNDSCILFYLKFLQYQVDVEEDNYQINEYDGSSSMINLIDPSVISFFIHQCNDQEDINDFLSGFHIPKPRRQGDVAIGSSIGKIFIPINDTMNVRNTNWMQPGSGNHWSLLLIVLEYNDQNADSYISKVSYYHFDSVIHSSNYKASYDVASKLHQHVFSNKILKGCKKNKASFGKNCHRTPTASSSNSDDCNVAQVRKTPQQINNFDCAIHMLMAIEQLLGVDSNCISDYELILSQYVQAYPQFCSLLRHKIYDTITNERNEKANNKKSLETK